MAAVSCSGCLKRDQQYAVRESEVADLKAAVRELTERLHTHATNSGIPLSANPPGAPSRSPSNRPAGSAAPRRDIRPT
jgi:hypothetical protein